MTNRNSTRPLRTIAFRSLLGGLALGSAITLIGGQDRAQAQAFGGLNSDAPVDYAADRMELQDKQNRVVLAGNVAITQADMRLNAQRTTVAYTNNGELKIQRIDATGGVTVTRGNESARGDVAIYDFNQRTITMAGNVGLRRGSDTLNGGRLVIDLDTGVASVDGRAGGGSPALGGSTGGGGRVSGTFSVPKRSKNN